MTEIQTPETNAVPYFPHQAPPPVPLTKRGWFLPVAVAAAVLFGAGGTAAVAANAAAAKTANCKVAFGHGDTALDAAGNTISYLGDGLKYAASFDADALRDLGPKIDTETARLNSVKEEFKTARALCEG
jgi:hypothetical protein